MRPPTEPDLARWRHRHQHLFSTTPTDCFQWDGAINAKGYGQTSLGNAVWRAHRAAYEVFVGPIPEGMQIDHLCRNRACVNPAHLEVVTNRENTMRGVSFSARNARKTHCPQGHLYDDVLADGRRRCKTCRAEQHRASRARKALVAS